MARRFGFLNHGTGSSIAIRWMMLSDAAFPPPAPILADFTGGVFGGAVFFVVAPLFWH